MVGRAAGSQASSGAQAAARVAAELACLRQPPTPSAFLDGEREAALPGERQPRSQV